MRLAFGIPLVDASTSQHVISRLLNTLIARIVIFRWHSYYGRGPYKGLTFEPETTTRINELSIESVLVDRKRVANLERIVAKLVLFQARRVSRDSFLSPVILALHVS